MKEEENLLALKPYRYNQIYVEVLRTQLLALVGSDKYLFVCPGAPFQAFIQVSAVDASAQTFTVL